MPKSRRTTFAGFAEQIAQHWLPPVATRALKDVFGANHFYGDFSSWADAKLQCEGYSTEAILQRVAAGALEVKEGRASYERDSQVFYEKAYEWPALASLLWAANREGGALSVLDFGGSLGSRYYQHRKWFEGLKHLRWSIVEQENFARVGRERFQDDTLRFYTDAAECVAAEKPTVLTISAVLQYVEEPYVVMNRLLDLAFNVILLDRTSLIEGSKDRLTLQRVSSRIYPATYPAWFFSRAKLLELFEGRYRLVEDFACPDRANLARSTYRGFLFERIER